MAVKLYSVLCLLVFRSVSSMYSSKEMEGYPMGYMSDCPGSTKEAFINKKSLKHLSIAVKGPPDEFNNFKKYNYYQMRELAKNPDVDFSKKTLLYVGGYLDSPAFPLATSMAGTYKEVGYTALMLDTNYFTTVQYPRAARIMRPVGKHVAKMLVDLTKEGLDPKKLELVGISLGSHTASFIAKNFQRMTGKNISRITGLDPAGPCFRNLGPEGRIDRGDADFVDVISTNIDGFGMAAPVGHITYYVNGGENQIGSVFWFACSTLCSHVKSHSFWMSAIQNPDSFIAIKCDSVQQARNRDCYDNKPLVINIMGLKVDKTKEGIYYLSTNNEYPYYLGEKGIKKENDAYTSLITSFNEKKVLRM